MNRFLDKLEAKVGRYAIRNLTIYIIGLYVIGYILQLAPASVNITSYLTLNPYLVLHGQVWRLISWVLIPPGGVSIWLIITLYFYYFIGTTMERTMGTFRYNVFIFGGILAVMLSAFVSYLVYYLIFTAKLQPAVNGVELALSVTMDSIAGIFSTYYIQEAVFLSFALCYPDLQLLLFFIIPVKVKYLGIFYAAILCYDALVNGLYHQIYPLFFVILFQFINLLLFYLQTGKLSHLRPKEVKRRAEFNRGAKMMPKGVTRHKCAVCGRTESTNPELEFRFCSKCNGNYEYCQDHLFTHQHVQ